MTDDSTDRPADAPRPADPPRRRLASAPASNGEAGHAGSGRGPADRALAVRMLASVKAGRDVRERKIRRLRAAIRVRAYENDLKLAVAVERMRTDLLGSAGEDVEGVA